MLFRPASLDALMDWLEKNRPDIASEIGSMSLPDGAEVLCRVTGVSVRPSDSIDDGCRRFLAALEERRESIVVQPDI